MKGDRRSCKLDMIAYYSQYLVVQQKKRTNCKKTLPSASASMEVSFHAVSIILGRNQKAILHAIPHSPHHVLLGNTHRGKRNGKEGEKDHKKMGEVHVELVE